MEAESEDKACPIHVYFSIFSEKAVGASDRKTATCVHFKINCTIFRTTSE